MPESVQLIPSSWHYWCYASGLFLLHALFSYALKDPCISCHAINHYLHLYFKLLIQAPHFFFHFLIRHDRLVPMWWLELKEHKIEPHTLSPSHLKLYLAEHWLYGRKVIYLTVHAPLLNPVPLCDPTNCNPPSSSVHGILLANTKVGCHFLLQGLFPIRDWT